MSRKTEPVDPASPAAHVQRHLWKAVAELDALLVARLPDRYHHEWETVARLRDAARAMALDTAGVVDALDELP